MSTLAQEGGEAIMPVLRGARGFLRTKLASRIPMRTMPQLRFRYDPSAARGARIDQLLSELSEELGTEKNEDS